MWRQPLQSGPLPVYSKLTRSDDGMWSNGRRIQAENRKNASRRALGSGSDVVTRRVPLRFRHGRSALRRRTAAAESLFEAIVDRPRMGAGLHLNTDVLPWRI